MNIDPSLFSESQFLIVLFNVFIFSIAWFLKSKWLVVLSYYMWVYLCSCFYYLFWD